MELKKVNNYFSHDFNARNDIKLKKVNMQLGLQGIGLYWCIIECLYENDGYLSMDEDIHLLAYELRTDEKLIVDLIENFDLFKKNKNKFFSPSVLARLEKINDKANINRENALKRWQKSGKIAAKDDDTAVLPSKYENDTAVLRPQYYIKENKIKENKRKIYNNSFITTTTDNIYSFIEENFGRLLSMIECEKIDHWISEYDIEVIKYAITIAVMNQKKTFAYVEGILKNWKGNGYKTLEEIKENEIKLPSNNHYDSKSPLNEENILFDYNWLEEDE